MMLSRQDILVLRGNEMATKKSDSVCFTDNTNNEDALC